MLTETPSRADALSLSLTIDTGGGTPHIITHWWVRRALEPLFAEAFGATAGLRVLNGMLAPAARELVLSARAQIDGRREDFKAFAKACRSRPTDKPLFDAECILLGLAHELDAHPKTTVRIDDDER